jgi:hypothetical protein
MQEQAMSLPQALAQSMCAEHADAEGRVLVCQSQTGLFDLYLHDRWVHCPSVEEAAAALFSKSIDLSAGWLPLNPRGE